MEEIWKDIEGFEGVYQISSFGRLKSFKSLPEGRILSNKNSKGGYLSVILNPRQEGQKSEKIHRLVAKAFIPNPENKPQVNHKNMDKQDNRVENLEWATLNENMKHAAINNPDFMRPMIYRNQVQAPNRIVQKTLKGEVLNVYLNAKEASNTTGVCRRNILQVAKKTEYAPGKYRKQAGGFVWEYKDKAL